MRMIQACAAGARPAVWGQEDATQAAQILG